MAADSRHLTPFADQRELGLSDQEAKSLVLGHSKNKLLLEPAEHLGGKGRSGGKFQASMVYIKGSGSPGLLNETMSHQQTEELASVSCASLGTLFVRRQGLSLARSSRPSDCNFPHTNGSVPAWTNSDLTIEGPGAFLASGIC